MVTVTVLRPLQWGAGAQGDISEATGMVGTCHWAWRYSGSSWNAWTSQERETAVFLSLNTNLNFLSCL